MYPNENIKHTFLSYGAINNEIIAHNQYASELAQTEEQDQTCAEMAEILQTEARDLIERRSSYDLDIFTDIGRRALAHDKLIAQLSKGEDEPTLETAISSIDNVISQAATNTFIGDVVRRQAEAKKQALIKEDSEINELLEIMPTSSEVLVTTVEQPSSPEEDEYRVPASVYDNVPYALTTNSTNGRTSNPKDSKHKWGVYAVDLEDEARIDRLLKHGTMEHIIDQCAEHKPIRDLPKLRSLIERAQRTDMDARNELIVHNLGLCVHFAKSFRRQALALGSTLDMEDLVQQGVFGISRAIELTDLSRVKSPKVFSSYVALHIRSAVVRHIRDTAETIRLPANIGDELSAINAVEQRLTSELGRQPTDNEIAERLSGFPITSPMERSLDQPEETADYARYRANRAVIARTEAEERARDRVHMLRSLRPKHLNYEYLEFSDDPELVDPQQEFELHDNAEHDERRRFIEEAMKSLSYRERRVLELRYGTEDDLPRTLDQVGRTFNVTRERVRQIENQSLKKLQMTALSTKARESICLSPEDLTIYDAMAGKQRFMNVDPYLWRLDAMKAIKELSEQSDRETLWSASRARVKQDQYNIDDVLPYKGKGAPFQYLASRVKAEIEILKQIASRVYEQDDAEPEFVFDQNHPHNSILVMVLNNAEKYGLVVQKEVIRVPDRARLRKVVPVRGTLMSAINSMEN